MGKFYYVSIIILCTQGYVPSLQCFGLHAVLYAYLANHIILFTRRSTQHLVGGQPTGLGGNGLWAVGTALLVARFRLPTVTSSY